MAPHPVDLEDTVSGLLQPPDPLDVATVPEGTAHPDFDAILYDWRRLAALAWSGFVTAGRGIVVVDLRDDGPRFGFEPGPPCECHARWLSEYDPTEEVLIVVRRGAEEWIFRLGGWPTPPEAFDELQDAGTVLRP